MTVCADPIDAKQRIKLNRAPQNQNEEALKDELKGMGFTWSGFGENGKWTGDKTCVDIWKDSTWRARVKLCCSAISFYGPNGEDMAMHDYISAVEAFDNTALDDDLSSLGKSVSCSQHSRARQTLPKIRRRNVAAPRDWASVAIAAILECHTIALPAAI